MAVCRKRAAAIANGGRPIKPSSLATLRIEADEAQSETDRLISEIMRQSDALPVTASLLSACITAERDAAWRRYVAEVAEALTKQEAQIRTEQGGPSALESLKGSAEPAVAAAVEAKETTNKEAARVVKPPAATSEIHERRAAQTAWSRRTGPLF